MAEQNLNNKPQRSSKERQGISMEDTSGVDEKGSPSVVPPEQLVYTGGLARDPQEVISNPAVVPQTPDDSVRALRSDMLREPEDGGME